jgi:hypothetical protein
MSQAWRSQDRFPIRWIFFNLLNPFSCTMALGSTQPLTEVSTRNLLESKEWPARRADNLTAICEPNVSKTWEPQHLTTLWASTSYYRDSFTLPYMELLRSVVSWIDLYKTPIMNLNLFCNVNTFPLSDEKLFHTLKGGITNKQDNKNNWT